MCVRSEYNVGSFARFCMLTYVKLAAQYLTHMFLRTLIIYGR